MSITTSLLNSWRYSNAKRATRTQASGSSPFTWKIGACTVRATSVAYLDERAAFGDVVNPTWLLTITWMVPPVRYPGSWDKFKVSATTPCPANAASPCNKTGRIEYASRMFVRSCFARTIPSRTGFTASKCEGFAAR